MKATNSSYIYTIDETPYSTAQRVVKGYTVYRQPGTKKVARYIRRHNLRVI